MEVTGFSEAHCWSDRHLSAVGHSKAIACRKAVGQFSLSHVRRALVTLRGPRTGRPGDLQLKVLCSAASRPCVDARWQLRYLGDF